MSCAFSCGAPISKISYLIAERCGGRSTCGKASKRNEKFPFFDGIGSNSIEVGNLPAKCLIVKVMGMGCSSHAFGPSTPSTSKPTIGLSSNSFFSACFLAWNSSSQIRNIATMNAVHRHAMKRGSSGYFTGSINCKTSRINEKGPLIRATTMSKTR